MPRILFIASHRPGRAPGQRFRFEQYLPYLKEHGFHCDLSYLVTESDDRVIYKPGHYWEKAMFLRRSIAKRRQDLDHIQAYDVVFIFREALMAGSTYFERSFKRSNAKLVFDFDDSIWLDNVSEANRRFAWLKGAGKTSRIIGLCDHILAGNRYLAEYAGQFNANVSVVPTTIDTNEYVPTPRSANGPITIGWSGSITTIQHFRGALPALRMIKERFGARVDIEVIGDEGYREDSLGVHGRPWRKDTEVADLSRFDIGIMPLPDDPWAKGKCGLKGLQYMGLGIPTIMSPVGVNTEIIQDGVNGFLAGDTQEWVDKLTRLIDDPELRRTMGTEARRTVEARYSVHAWKDRYLQLFQDLIRTTT
jgi:glycosyltransferase involved in cell wall biosynthesis